jgi:uncharacterized protein (UPF0332 family)
LLSQKAIDLARYRINKAKIDVSAAQENFNLQLYETSANRSYYAIFHAISDFIKNAFDIRNDSDYEDFFVISKKDVEAQILNAKKFVDCLDVYVNKIIIDEV